MKSLEIDGVTIAMVDDDTAAALVEFVGRVGPGTTESFALRQLVISEQERSLFWNPNDGRHWQISMRQPFHLKLSIQFNEMRTVIEPARI